MSVFVTPGTQQTITDPIVPTCRLRAVRVRHIHMRSIVVARCVCRSLPSVFHHLLLPGTRFTSYVFTYRPRLAYLYHLLSLCCFFCVLLCVIQQCQCSSCARHSAPTAEAGGILCACGRCALHSQYYSSTVCCCHRYWPMPIPAAVCDRHFLLTDHPWIVCIRRVQYNQSVVRASCTAAFVQNTYSSS